jgi:hypothetical protein
LREDNASPFIKDWLTVYRRSLAEGATTNLSQASEIQTVVNHFLCSHAFSRGMGMLRLKTRSRHGEELIWLVPVGAGCVLLFLIAEIVGAVEGISAAALLEDYGHWAVWALPLLLQFAFFGVLIRGLLSGSSSPVRAILTPIRDHFGSPMLVASCLMPMILLPLMFAGVAVFKMMLPYHVPFAWDDAFAAADRILFFGRQPWQLTHWLLGRADVTVVIDRVYTIWVYLLSVAIVGVALFAPRYDRARFFLTFTAAWILLGVIGAWLTSSAGPCYTMLLGAASAPEFEPLMARLRDISANHGTLGAVDWQNLLWQAYDGRRYGFGMGISAMPSLHNAITVLYALALSRFGRKYAVAGWLFALLIFISSIHLGWHYAVDGIIAAAAMIPIWRAAGRYLARTGYEAAVAADTKASTDVSADPVLA